MSIPSFRRWVHATLPDEVSRSQVTVLRDEFRGGDVVEGHRAGRCPDGESARRVGRVLGGDDGAVAVGREEVGLPVHAQFGAPGFDAQAVDRVGLDGGRVRAEGDVPVDAVEPQPAVTRVYLDAVAAGGRLVGTHQQFGDRGGVVQEQVGLQRGVVCLGRGDGAGGGSLGRVRAPAQRGRRPGAAACGPAGEVGGDGGDGGWAEGDGAALGEQAHRAGVVAVVLGVEEPLAVDMHRQLGSVGCHFEVIGSCGPRARKWSGGECVAAGQVVEPYAGAAGVEGDRVSGRAFQGCPERQRAYGGRGLGRDAGRVRALGRELLLGPGRGRARDGRRLPSGRRRRCGSRCR